MTGKLKEIELPDELLKTIALRAAKGGVSVEEQVVVDLSTLLYNPSSWNEEKLLEEIQREREAMAARGVMIDNELIRDAKSWGRK